MTSQPPNRAAQAEALFAAGQKAFERGRYQNAVIAFEAGNRLVKGSTFLGGNIQLWLMNAYSAAGREEEAIALGEKLIRHPDRDVRKQSQRVLEILQAPQLSRRADWVTPLPDLSELEESKDTDFTLRKYDPPRKPAQSFSPAPVPEDLSQINTNDNGFLGAAIVLILLLLGGVWWLA